MTKVEPSHLALDLVSLTLSEHVEATKDQSEDSSSDEDNNKDEYIYDKFPDEDEKETILTIGSRGKLMFEYLSDSDDSDDDVSYTSKGPIHQRRVLGSHQSRVNP